ncbi:hypothetical protein EMCRGX_G016241 [Ephydatia muelleri]
MSSFCHGSLEPYKGCEEDCNDLNETHLRQYDMSGLAKCSDRKPADLPEPGDGKHLLVYCPKLNPPVYRYIKESNAYYHIGSIIHYYCNYGYELYGSSWNKCVYEYGVAKWEYPVPICKPKVYSG